MNRRKRWSGHRERPDRQATRPAPITTKSYHNRFGMRAGVEDDVRLVGKARVYVQVLSADRAERRP